MVQIKWLEEAKQDLKEIYEYIASDSAKYARYQVLQIKNRTQLLKVHPYAGKTVEEINDPEIKEIVVSHYRIIYRVVNKKLIHIMLVHHRARDLTRRLRN